ncbi:MAG: PhnD/SsuA/transferrin family substrate-binding protein [Pirellulales bacterium]
MRSLGLSIRSANRAAVLLTAVSSCWAALFVLCATPSLSAVEKIKEPTELVMVVMDPLAKPLSCPCVAGYAQRDYQRLADALTEELGLPVKVHFKESLTGALQNDTRGRADLVIGKHSVVLYDSKRSKLDVTPVARLTGKQGGTTMTGLVIVPSSDSAKSLADVSGYRLVFGPEECDEKNAAAVKLFQANKVALPDELETAVACDEGAILILDDAKQGKHGVAVISSYAKPLLEGCGTVEKGSLRVIGETEPVPFIEAFVTEQLTGPLRQRLAAALVSVSASPELRIALETQDGFIAMEDPRAIVKKKN